MTTSRQLVRSFMGGGRCERNPVLPIAFYHAARIDGGPFSDLVFDATRLSRALLEQRQLFGGDCVTVRFDEAWIADAAGVPIAWHGDVPQIAMADDDDPSWELPQSPSDVPVFEILLDVVDRLCKQLRREAPVMVTLPGPLRLAAAAGGDSSVEARATAILRDLAERCCQAGAELVLLRELEDVDPDRIESAAMPIFNTLRYYNAHPILWGPRGPYPSGSVHVLYSAEVRPDPRSGARSGAIVPPACFDAEAGLTAFVTGLATLADPRFLVVLDEVLAEHTVETNTAVLRALQQDLHDPLGR